MKVRAVTVGLSLLQEGGEEGQGAAGQLTSCAKERLTRAANLGNQVKAALEQAGYEVQTVRVCTDPFEAWLKTADEAAVLAQIKALDQILEELGLEFCSIGPCKTLEALRLVPLILQTSSRISASLAISTNATPDSMALMDEGARTIFRISRHGDGLGNFRFCVAFCCRPGIPFFPAAYHGRGGHAGDQELMAVGLGLENSDLIVKAFSGCHSLPEASTRLEALLGEHLVALERVAQRAVEEAGGHYNGIDASANPSLVLEESLVRAYESLLGHGGFGTVGTLAVSEVITRAIRRAPIRHVGYSGLMLPVLEDRLLAQRAAQDPPAYRLTDLLSYSSVCGVGLDTIPIGGDEDSGKVARVLFDVAALACRYDKQLSVRLFPTPGKAPGDVTTFVSPYLCNTRVFTIS